jgi:copper chaperone CopZ
VTQQKFHVREMHCSNCVMTIESLEDELPGVRSIRASYRKGEMVVEFDESQISVEVILRAVEQVGYTAVPAG